MADTLYEIRTSLWVPSWCLNSSTDATRDYRDARRILKEKQDHRWKYATKEVAYEDSRCVLTIERFVRLDEVSLDPIPRADRREGEYNVIYINKDGTRWRYTGNYFNCIQSIRRDSRSKNPTHNVKLYKVRDYPIY